MIRRIIVSVEQFTSFRGFAWCPLGSLHRRLRPFDPSTAFQQAVEELQEQGAVVINEYDNPLSEFKTKGISLVEESPIVQRVLDERNRFVRALLALYEQRLPLSREAIRQASGLDGRELDLWLSIMQAENVLKAVPGQTDLYSLFRTHHTVCMVAGDRPPERRAGSREWKMALEEQIQQYVQELPRSLQEEVLDFVQYLLMKAEQQEKREWSTLSLSSALRGMENEESLYTLADLKVTFG